MSNAFRTAIAATPDVAGHWQIGLRALGANSSRVALADTSKCNGSLDIDTALTPVQRNANRWDYALMYDGRVVYLEVHPAASGANINEMIAKVRWLQNWLTTRATALRALPTRYPFIWVASGKTNLLPSGAQRTALADAGLKPISHLRLG